MSSDIREYITNNDIRFENESDIPDSLLLDYQTDRRLSKTIHNRMLDLGFTNATPIQAISLPIALNGRDLIDLFVFTVDHLGILKSVKSNLNILEPLLSEKKKLLLRTILSEFAGMKLLIFTNTKRCCETMSNYVNKLGLTDCDYIHGDLSQENRQRVIRLFDNNKLMVLFATDVAARGLASQFSI
ncbi:hypothetical protein NH340_JMT09235 [Sarcoptes scabiei]|nr:hypothetical protein NH340_JMT09235 [Sarcoptes scabiei]